MKVLFDMLSGVKPRPIDMIYNGSLAVDNATKRYSGSIAKMMDYDDQDHGRFITFGGLTTIGERPCGILEEETSAEFLLDDADYGPLYRKITPCLPSTVVEAEYARKDRAGTSNLDTNFTGSTTSITCGDSITVDDVLIGGWLYFTNGLAANQLHYITDSTTAGIIVVATSVAAVIAAADDLIVILPPMTSKFLFDATYTGIKSDCDDATWSHPAQGISTWIEAPGIPKQKLDRNLHDGLKIPNARFYHQFTFCGTFANAGATKPNAWMGVPA